MKTLDGETVALVGSLLERVTVTPPCGAAAESEIVSVELWPRPTDSVGGTVIPPNVVTVMEAVPLPMLGVVVLAVMVAAPVVPAVTGTVTLVVFAAMVTDAGTLATDGLVELRLTTTAELEALEIESVRFCEPPVPMVELFGVKLSTAET